MFHVSTLLPYSAEDMQQLERKRHIGNDIVIIVFQDGDDVFRPQAITSRQIQIIFLIKPETVKGKPGYRFSFLFFFFFYLPSSVKIIINFLYSLIKKI